MSSSRGTGRWSATPWPDGERLQWRCRSRAGKGSTEAPLLCIRSDAWEACGTWPLSGGRFLFDLIGLSRVKFEEWRQLTPYRIARCSSLPEKGTGPLSSRAHEKALQLSVTFQALLQELSGMKGPLQLGSDLSLETTVNRICFALEIDAE